MEGIPSIGSPLRIGFFAEFFPARVSHERPSTSRARFCPAPQSQVGSTRRPGLSHVPQMAAISCAYHPSLVESQPALQPGGHEVTLFVCCGLFRAGTPLREASDSATLRYCWTTPLHPVCQVINLWIDPQKSDRVTYTPCVNFFQPFRAGFSINNFPPLFFVIGKPYGAWDGAKGVGPPLRLSALGGIICASLMASGASSPHQRPLKETKSPSADRIHRRF